jgi:hypothetical protein
MTLRRGGLAAMTPRDRRALRMGIPLLLAGLAWHFAVAPYLREVRAVSEQLRLEREILASERGLLASAGVASSEVRRLSQELIAAAPRLVGGPNEQAATAALTGFLEYAARQNRVYLSRVEPAAPEPAGEGLVAIPIRLRGESDLEGILSLLHGLEHSSKLLRIEALSVKSTRPGQLVAREEAEVLEFDLVAKGFMLAQAGPRPARQRMAAQ